HAHAHRRDFGTDILHRVVDREAGGDDAARRIDVEGDVLGRVLALEEQKLRADQACNRVIDRADEKNDALLQQPRIDVVGALAAVGLLDHHRNEVVHINLKGIHRSLPLLILSSRGPAGARLLQLLPASSAPFPSASASAARSSLSGTARSLTCANSRMKSMIVSS